MSETALLADSTLLDTMTWFEKARPNPTRKDFSTQLGVHLEEVGEMLAALKGNDHSMVVSLELAIEHLHVVAEKLKADETSVDVQDPLEMLDGLCDQIVTGTGVAFTLGYDLLGAMDEVNRSNFSKFGADGLPIYNENRKIIKGPNYFKADLVPYLRLPGVLQHS